MLHRKPSPSQEILKEGILTHPGLCSARCFFSIATLRIACDVVWLVWSLILR